VSLCVVFLCAFVLFFPCVLLFFVLLCFFSFRVDFVVLRSP